MEEPENLLRSYPLVFHETVRNRAKGRIYPGFGLGRKASQIIFSQPDEIDMGAGIFENSPKLSLSLKALVPELDRSVSDISDSVVSLHTDDVSNKTLRSIAEFNDLGFAIFIAVGAEAEKKELKAFSKKRG